MLDSKYVTDKILDKRQNKYIEQLANITDHKKMSLSAKLDSTVHKFYESKVV